MAKYKEVMSRKFYVKMFEHFIALLNKTRVEVCTNLINIFKHLVEIRDLVIHRPALRHFLITNMNALSLTDLMTCYKLYESDQEMQTFLVNRIAKFMKTEFLKALSIEDITELALLSIRTDELRKPFIDFFVTSTFPFELRQWWRRNLIKQIKAAYHRYEDEALHPLMGIIQAANVYILKEKHVTKEQLRLMHLFTKLPIIDYTFFKQLIIKNIDFI